MKRHKDYLSFQLGRPRHPTEQQELSYAMVDMLDHLAEKIEELEQAIGSNIRPHKYLKDE